MYQQPFKNPFGPAMGGQKSPFMQSPLGKMLGPPKASKSALPPAPGTTSTPTTTGTDTPTPPSQQPQQQPTSSLTSPLNPQYFGLNANTTNPKPFQMPSQFNVPNTLFSTPTPGPVAPEFAWYYDPQYQQLARLLGEGWIYGGMGR